MDSKVIQEIESSSLRELEKILNRKVFLEENLGYCCLDLMKKND